MRLMLANYLQFHEIPEGPVESMTVEDWIAFSGAVRGGAASWWAKM